MGYDLHITRADDWSDTRGKAISVAEWIDLIDADETLDLDVTSGPYSATWSDPASPARASIDWYDGAIFTTNPDRPTVAKLIEIAKSLRAHVQGDDGESYESAAEFEPRGD